MFDHCILYLIRFAVGASVVSTFAFLGGIFRPRSLAGLFAAAPSIAIATLSITFLEKGSEYASIEGRSMVIGSIALCAYSFLVLQLLKRFQLSALTSTTMTVVAWLACAFGLLSLLIG